MSFPNRSTTSTVPISTDINDLAQGLPEYRSDRTYIKNTFIWHGDPAIIYRSLVVSNQGNTPASSPTKWEAFSSGINEISFKAGEWFFPSTNPAPLDTDSGSNGVIKRILFDDTTEEFVLNQFVLPGTLKSGTGIWIFHNSKSCKIC